MRFKIDWASLIVGSKFTVFALFYLLYLKAISKYKPRGGAYIWRGDLTEVFFGVTSSGDLYLEGLIHGGTYFRNFTVLRTLLSITLKSLGAINRSQVTVHT